MIDVLATDHAPHTLRRKGAALHRRRRAGCRWCSTRWSRRWSWCTKARLTTAQVVQKFAHAPAQLFDVHERGFLREGYWADLVLVDDAPFTVRREDVLSKCGWSPFEGTTFHSRIATTWVNGAVVVERRAAGRRAEGAAAGVRSLKAAVRSRRCCLRGGLMPRARHASRRQRGSRPGRSHRRVARRSTTSASCFLPAFAGRAGDRQGAARAARSRYAGRKLRVTTATARVVFGVGRDETGPLRVEVRVPDGGSDTMRIDPVTPRDWPIEHINGVPPKTVNPPPDDRRAHRARTGRRWSPRALRDDDRADFAQAFTWPVQGRISGRFGNARSLQRQARQRAFGHGHRRARPARR